MSLSTAMGGQVSATLARMESPCVPWHGSRNVDGYGRLARRMPDGKMEQYAHRWTWAQVHGPIPPGMVIMHTCDNPPCVEITHLRLGTYQENAQDSIAKGRRALIKEALDKMDANRIRELPLEEKALLATMLGKRDRARLRARMVELHDVGYSYAAIAEGAGVSRQRVHQIVAQDRGDAPEQRARARRQVPPAIAETLRWSWTASASRRGSTVDGTMPAAAHRVFVDTVTGLLRDGVTFAAVAEVLGVEEGTVRGRMLRAGVTRKVARATPAEDVA